MHFSIPSESADGDNPDADEDDMADAEGGVHFPAVCRVLPVSSSVMEQASMAHTAAILDPRLPLVFDDNDKTLDRFGAET